MSTSIALLPALPAEFAIGAPCVELAMGALAGGALSELFEAGVEPLAETGAAVDPALPLVDEWGTSGATGAGAAVFAALSAQLMAADEAIAISQPARMD